MARHIDMRRSRRFALFSALVAGVVTVGVAPGSAHKPITSPYTYNEDVFPVLRDRCGRCHVPGGVAPMSLMTHADTVPWGESIRMELLAGHMPPWSVDAAPSRFLNMQPLTAREMNVLLTWATGGTPLGDPDKSPTPPTLNHGWVLGPPDLQLLLPSEFALGASTQEDTIDFVIPTGTRERRFVRAVDLLPGTPSIVRAATVRVRSAPSTPSGTPSPEPVLAVWLPGDEPVALDDAAFELPAGAELLVRVHYKKTWQFERKEMRDRSTVGLYFASSPSTAVRAITLSPDASVSGAATPGRLSFGRTLDEDVQALAIYPGNDIDKASVVVTAVTPNGSRRELIAFHPRAGWSRRYWFRQPIALARGTRLDATVTLDDQASLLPLSAAPARPRRQDSATIRLTVNVVAAR